MKKILLVVVIAVGFSQAKAQQLFQTKPADSLKNNPLQKFFDTKPGIQPPLFNLQVNPGLQLAATTPQVKVSNFDHMPVAVLTGSSKMPVAKLGIPEKMPVLKLGDGNTLEVQKTPVP